MLKTLIMKAAFIAFVGSISFAAHAIADTQRFDVPAGDLIAALESFSKQADVDLVYQDEQVKGLRTGGVSGHFSPRDAVMKLLEGTSLQLHTDEASGALLITAPSPSGGPAPSATEENQPKAAARADSAAVREKRSFWSRFRLAQAETNPSARGVRSESRNSQEENSSRASAEAEKSRIVLEEIVVTGTHIKGVAPAGQKLTVIDRSEIDRSGHASAQDLIRALPQNFTGNVREDSFSSTGGNLPNPGNSAKSSAVNLRGLGADSTLTLVNGRRLAPGGARGGLVDISMIPLTAVERVEVLVDGASALYGADAVGGVVNFILRKDYDGAETRLRFGSVTDGDQRQLQLGQTFGHSWLGGNLLLSAQFDDNTELLFSERDRTNADLRPFGGRDFRFTRCNPGTLVVGSVTYAIPAGQNGQALDPAALVPGTQNLCSPNSAQALFPDEMKWSLLGRVAQELDDRFSVFVDAVYGRRSVESPIPNNNLRIAVPSTNAFYVNPTGGTGPVRVDYDFTADLGPRRFENDISNSSVAVGLDVNLGHDWSLSASTGPSEYKERQFQTSTPDPAGLSLVLADSNPATAFNPFGDGSNTNPQTLTLLRDSSTITFDVDSRLWLSSVILDGPLVSVPGGNVSLAIGADYRDATYESGSVVELRVSGSIIPSSSAFARRVKAFFGEVFVPIVGEGNGIDGIRRLELSVAGRSEEYSDFGDAFSPRVGVIWSPIAGASIRGSWSESFKAPLLPDLDETFNGSFISDITDTQSLTGSSPTLIWFGNNNSLQPETATIWSVGMDIAPELFAGVSFSATYFNIDFVDRIAPPPNTFALVPANGSANIYDPALALRQEICGSTNFLGNFSSAPGDCLSTNIEAVLDTRLQNLANAEQRGVDFDAAYDVAVGAGNLRVGLNTTYLFEYSLRATTAAPVLHVLDTEGDPLRWKLRGYFGWSDEDFGATVYINYANGYRDTVSDPNERIDAWTTVDLNLAYSIPDALSDGTTLSLNVRNIFDEDPPLFLAGTQGIGYDTANAGLQGRFVSVALTQRW